MRESRTNTLKKSESSCLKFMENGCRYALLTAASSDQYGQVSIVKTISPATAGWVVRVVGLEPTLLAETDFESVASTIPPHPHSFMSLVAVSRSS